MIVDIRTGLRRDNADKKSKFGISIGSAIGFYNCL